MTREDDRSGDAKGADPTPDSPTPASGIEAHEAHAVALELLARLTSQLNLPGDFRERMAQLTASLQEWSGCEAVGVRLHIGDDYPYFETRGFPAEFVQAESHLCAYGPDGEIQRDGAGNPVLECMCGNVLCGRFDPAKPFFTEHGSFWTNCTSDLLGSTTETDRQSRTRDRCNGEGYESVALVPLRVGEEAFGLLQFNDRRRGRFTRARIAGFERLADNLAIVLSRNRAEAALRESEERYRGLFEHMAEGYAYCQMIFEDGVARDWIYISVNRAFENLTGLKEVVGKRVTEVIPGVRETDPGLFEIYSRVVRTGQHEKFETFVEALQQWFSISVYSPRPEYFIAVFEVITERKRVEEDLKESKARLELAYRSAGAGTWDWDMQTEHLVWSRELYELFGLDPDGVAASFETWRQVIHPGDRGEVERGLGRAIRENVPLVNEYRVVHPGGEVRWISTLGHTTRDPAGQPVRMSGICIDITARKRAEEEGARLAAQLQQAQKMESVGRLAGGVAHDFNNMLGAIIGHTELALRRVDPAHPLHADLTEIRKAAGRSADLTRQLLAFARRQTVAPRVLDLNAAVGGTLRMLERLIGEDIGLAWQPAADLWPVRVDPSQIDQVLANLCVNARDSISGVGKVTIETSNRVFDEAYCAAHPGYVPGEYVRLAVSDDGCGMDQETLGHLFEPFFTTKELGTGTGLGLATVYGIVKQNQGFINVYSEPGVGSTFTIHLPRCTGAAEPARAKSETPTVPRGDETILVVEDERTILQMIATMLETQGYTVLAAGTPGEAIRLATEHAGEIPLLLTDVVMPEMNGRELAGSLRSLHPRLKSLFMSGYTADVIAHRGVLDEGVRFLQKPFSIQELSAKVRQALDSD